ncbi:MAG: hypothetical protein H6728_03380 [Myxococcales bacterium]|nr:hypothetical protein [Myxococcales bacterium]MCB9642092.1 hypothetical protein [Myxococcales bacterium]
MQEQDVMWSKLLHVGVWRRACLVVLCGLWFGLGSQQANAGTSTAFGGALLGQGEVILAGGVGFPEAFFHFDFANSSQFNLAFQARINYNLGLPFFGGFGFINVPMRIGIIQDNKFSFALKLDPGGFIGGNGSQLPFIVGFQLGVAALFTIHVMERFNLNFGVELPMLLSFDPNNRLTEVGFHLPVELMVGGEVEINEKFSVFANVSGGPYVYFGNLARRLTFFSTDAYVSGSFRFLVGVIWRR